MSTTEHRDGNGSFIAGFIFGALVGGILAGMWAPRSGEQTREIVRERGLELKDRAEDAVLRAQTVANETLARVQSSVRSSVPGSQNTTGTG